jgi:hypothetical protein
MPNTQTSVPLYAQGEVLTAANLNLTNSGIPVFATTVTRDAAFGGANEKVLAEGQFAYIEATNTTQYYDGAAWQAVGASSGLVLITAQAVGTAVSSVTVSSVFSATYDQYKIVAIGGTQSVADNMLFKFGATATGYDSFVARGQANGATDFAGDNNASSFQRFGFGNTDGYFIDAIISDPFATKRTKVEYTYTNTETVGTVSYGKGVGFLRGSTSYTAFTITPGSGTLTGGTVYVYGYAKS